jgi:predicted RNA-binding protein Jag
MSDVPSEAEAVVSPPAEAPAGPKVDKREQSERVIGDMLRLMGLPGRVDAKEVAAVKAEAGQPGVEGGISVALMLEAELPGAQPGRRSHLVEAVQFLANKIINRPQTERKWISVGVGGHPAPRAALPPRPAGPPPEVRQPRAKAPRPVPAAAAPVVVSPPAEETVELPADPLLEALGRALAEKSAKCGRFLAVVPMKPDDRARVMKGAKGVEGATVKAEGEGRNRRLVFVPDKPAPMPKRAIVDYGDDEE